MVCRRVPKTLSALSSELLDSVTAAHGTRAVLKTVCAALTAQDSSNTIRAGVWRNAVDQIGNVSLLPCWSLFFVRCRAHSSGESAAPNPS
jgi:hypothetical protein